MDHSTYRKTTIAHLRGRKIRTLRTLTDGAWAVVPPGRLLSVQNVGLGGAKLQSDVCDECGIQFELNIPLYAHSNLERATMTEALQGGNKVRTESTHRNGSTEIPSGSVLTIERKRAGFTLRGDACSVCGVYVRAEMIRGEYVDLIDETGVSPAKIRVTNDSYTARAECLDCQGRESSTADDELDVAIRHVRETGHNVVLARETIYSMGLVDPRQQEVPQRSVTSSDEVTGTGKNG